jgi:5,10-methylenetetrahydromethanopterin reductase
VLGLGRGDSALTQIGRRPVPVTELESALVAIQGSAWSAGASRRRRELDRVDRRLRPAEGAGRRGRHRVHVIEVGARHAERLDFTVGAEPERVRWAVDTAREVEGGETVSLGVFVNVAVHPDRAVARDLVRGSTAILARFSTEGAPPDGLSEVTRAGSVAMRGLRNSGRRHPS